MKVQKIVSLTPATAAIAENLNNFSNTSCGSISLAAITLAWRGSLLAMRWSVR